jgi:PAS domain-containing protein
MSEQKNDDYYHQILDAIPLMVFVVDSDVRILDLNLAAMKTLGMDKSVILRKRGGEVLHCIHHRDSPEGCGRVEHCKGCIIRNSVNEAVSGRAVTRNRTRAELETPDGILDMDLLVTASTFDFGDEKKILLILEDVSEITRLRQFLPICAYCKKIRDDKNYWSSVEQFFTETGNVDFTHSICPECLKKEYPDIYDKMHKNGKI